MKTAVEWLIDEIDMQYPDINIKRKEWMIDKAKEMEKEQAELYAEFAVLNDRSENPLIPFNEFINIDNL
jgi:hypothetical protein